MTTHYKALTHRCIDPRVVEPESRFAEELNLTGQRYGSAAGGGVKDKEHMLKQLGIAVEHGLIEEVHLFNHTDCKAYGGREAFGSEEEEYNHHLQELRDAKALILQKYPHLKVHIYLMVIGEAAEIEEIDAPGRPAEVAA